MAEVVREQLLVSGFGNRRNGTLQATTENHMNSGQKLGRRMWELLWIALSFQGVHALFEFLICRFPFFLLALVFLRMRSFWLYFA
mmetsp:Transcript_355/g.412  ORF Transcript_355/g.412 Transcript_355/m.412 type:complete len:85 (+) Transcript_355:519-773(+)